MDMYVLFVDSHPNCLMISKKIINCIEDIGAQYVKDLIISISKK